MSLFVEIDSYLVSNSGAMENSIATPVPPCRTGDWQRVKVALYAERVLGRLVSWEVTPLRQSAIPAQPAQDYKRILAPTGSLGHSLHFHPTIGKQWESRCLRDSPYEPSGDINHLREEAISGPVERENPRPLFAHCHKGPSACDMNHTCESSIYRII